MCSLGGSYIWMQLLRSVSGCTTGYSTDLARPAALDRRLAPCSSLVNSWHWSCNRLTCSCACIPPVHLNHGCATTLAFFQQRNLLSVYPNFRSMIKVLQYSQQQFCKDYYPHASVKGNLHIPNLNMALLQRTYAAACGAWLNGNQSRCPPMLLRRSSMSSVLLLHMLDLCIPRLVNFSRDVPHSSTAKLL